MLRQLDGDRRVEVGDRQLEPGALHRRDDRSLPPPPVDDEREIVVAGALVAPRVDRRHEVLPHALEGQPDLLFVGAVHASSMTRSSPPGTPLADSEAMGELQPTHILLVLAVVLLLFGGSRIANVGKALGEGIRNFKAGIKSSDDKA